MASISNDPGGRRRILFTDRDGNRRTLRLGKVPSKAAQTFCARLERLVSNSITGDAPDAETARWIAGLGDSLHAKLAAVGLVTPREGDGPTLGAFLDGWLLARKGDYKPASRIAWGQVIAALKGFLGTDRALDDVTPADAESFRQSMLTAGLRATTIHKRLQHARLFFAHAMRQKVVTSNPFEHVRHRPGDASERRAYVPAADATRVMDHAPNNTWRLLIALSRFAGLRVPSEALSLRWQDVDWERQRLMVPSPKTEHLAGRSYRVIPLFPEIREHLERAWDDAPEGAVYIFPDEYRRRAQGPGGWANANLRTTLVKIIRRAGVEPWPRAWHSMRASCETDLARRFPLAVVAKWLGNTQAVAMRHYVDVTDDDFRRAVEKPEQAAQNPAQHAPEVRRIDPQVVNSGNEETPELPGVSTICDTLQCAKMEAAGIEPASCEP